MSDLDVRQLRYFVAVAEELHFGRAAERLSMAQPPLSRAVREMERLLGVQLLDRTTRSVALTAAGRVLLHEARRAIEAVDAASRRARQAGEPSAVLRLALKADYDAGLLPQVLAAYEQMPDALPVELVLGGRGEQAPALRDGRADVAVLVTPYDGRELDTEDLLTEPRLLALSTSDPLLSRAQLCLADLVGRVLPDGTPAEADGPPLAERIAAAGAPADGRPPLDLIGIFNLVEVGSILWFPPASLARRHVRPGIVYREVLDLAPVTFAVAWPQHSRSAAVAAFVRAAAGAAAALATAAPATAAPATAAASAAGPVHPARSREDVGAARR